MARPVTLSVEGHPTLLTTGFLSEVENKPDSVTDSVWIVAQCHPPCAVKSIALKNQASGAVCVSFFLTFLIHPLLLCSAFVTVWGVQSAEVSPLPASVLEHAHLLIPCTQVCFSFLDDFLSIVLYLFCVFHFLAASLSGRGSGN